MGEANEGARVAALATVSSFSTDTDTKTMIKGSLVEKLPE